MDKHQAKVPNYEPLINRIRTGMRKSKYYINPLEENEELTSMTGSSLNPQLSSIFSKRKKKGYKKCHQTQRSS